MTRRGMPVLLRLLAYALPYWKLWLTTVAITVGTSIAVVAAPELIGYAVDTGFDIVEETADGKTALVAKGSVATLGFVAAILLAVSLVRGVGAYFQTYLGEKLSQSIAYDMRNNIFDHLQRLSYAYHDTAQIGQIMSRATQDVEGIRMFVSMGVIRLLYITVLLGLSAFLMFRTNTRVAAIAFAFMPIVAIQSGVMGLIMRPLWMRVQDLQGQLATVLQESLTGMRVVKAFSREEFEQEKFDERADELFKASYRTSLIAAFNEPLMIALWLGSAALVFWSGAREIAGDRMSPGDMAAFMVYLTILQMPVRAMGFIVNMFARAHSAGSRVFDILDAESAVQDRPDATEFQSGAGEVVFENVAFGYDALSPVLHDVNIHARGGEIVALLGPTGSGKSTIVNLLPRFYDVTEGTIKIDGQDVRDVTMESLRAAIGTVQQDVFLFPATIADNIAYGRPDASREDVIEAASAARIHEFIDSLPDGYETWVGERGVTLSGGQRQRIAIARTLLLDPRVLIFDDSTSSVDMRTEYLIQEALQNLMKGRTTFVIAQRLRTVQRADQILVMRDGTIVEQGTHEELLEVDGLYREIYDLELRDQEEARAAAGEETAGDA